MGDIVPSPKADHVVGEVSRKWDEKMSLRRLGFINKYLFKEERLEQ